MLQGGISRGSEQRCRQHRFAASGGEQRGQAGLTATLQSGHIHHKHPGATAKRLCFSNMNCMGDKEAALIHACHKTENAWTCKKKSLDCVFKGNGRGETSLLPLCGYCEFMVCCCFINLQMVSGCRESNASEGGSSPKPTTHIWKTICKFLQCLYLCRIEDDFVCSWLIIIFQMYVPCCLIKRLPN